jgi:hypothetical protein
VSQRVLPLCCGRPIRRMAGQPATTGEARAILWYQTWL